MVSSYELYCSFSCVSRTQFWGAGHSVSVQSYLRLFTDNTDHFAQAARIVRYSQTVTKISLISVVSEKICRMYYILIFHITTVLWKCRLSLRFLLSYLKLLKYILTFKRKISILKRSARNYLMYFLHSRNPQQLFLEQVLIELLEFRSFLPFSVWQLTVTYYETQEDPKKAPKIPFLLSVLELPVLTPYHTCCPTVLRPLHHLLSKREPALISFK